MSSLIIHEREQDDVDVERYSKRAKTEDSPSLPEETEVADDSPPHILPPSHALLGVPLPVAQEGAAMNFMETDVGISEYVGKGVSKIEGIIKQRSAQIHQPPLYSFLRGFPGSLISWCSKSTSMDVLYTLRI